MDTFVDHGCLGGVLNRAGSSPLRQNPLNVTQPQRSLLAEKLQTLCDCAS